MLKLLLDEHISPAVAAALHRRGRVVAVLSLAEWENGRWLGERDDAILSDAEREGLTLVTYDRRTIPPLLKIWAESGRGHGGVIFVDEKTIAPSDFGRLARALQRLTDHHGNEDWANRIVFLQDVGKQ